MEQGFHFNRGLQTTCNSFGIKSFVFLVVEYGRHFEDLEYRRKAEIELIQSWPGPIYNIKDVKK